MSYIARREQKQTRPFALREYIEAGCDQFAKGADDVIALGIYGMTGGLMCNGCYASGNCKAFKQLNGVSVVRTQPQQPVAVETVRQEAARLGISINEVRRRRALS